jgi:hypothetical protein
MIEEEGRIKLLLLRDIIRMMNKIIVIYIGILINFIRILLISRIDLREQDIEYL